MELIAKTTIARHAVAVGDDGLSPMQARMLESRSLINVVNAPTGAGKSYVFQRAVLKGERCLFLVPTKRLGENQRRSLIESLCDPARAAAEGREAWSPEKAAKKVQCWNSDYTKELRSRGVSDISAHYRNRILSLSHAPGGEIVFATPELISRIFMHPGRDGVTGDIGAWNVVGMFDRIVYDEFHLIQERGFGLVALLAETARSWAAADGIDRRASIYLLSATPLDLRPVLENLGFDCSDPETVTFIDEELVDEGGRALHGDVTVEFLSARSPLEYLRDTGIMNRVPAGTKAVVLYDSVRGLRDDEEGLRELLLASGKDDFHFDSGQHNQIETEHTGRGREIESRDVVIGTSTLEVGITIPRVSVLVMNPGVSVLSMIQRIGRAARGNLDGHVVVVADLVDSKPWLRDFCADLGSMGGRVSIQDFMRAAVKASRLHARFACAEDDGEGVTFGTMGQRAVWASALYHLMVERRLREAKRGGHASRMREFSRPLSGRIAKMLHEVLGISGGRKWATAFLAESENLRSFGPTIAVHVEGRKEPVEYSESWITRNTRILDECPVELDDLGNASVRCSRAQWEFLRPREEYVPPSRRPVVLPDGSVRYVGKNEVSDYCALVKDPRVERRRRNAFEQARILVMMTGVVPFADGEVPDAGTMSCIL